MTNEIAEKSNRLIDSHKKSRAHLNRVLDGLDEDMWNQTPNSSRWSILRAGTHIVNAELMWMSRKSGEEPQYLSRETSLSEYRLRQDRVAAKFREKVRTESANEGFTVVSPAEGTPSYHWSMLRTIQHAIYHTGMISLLRQQVGAPQLMKDAPNSNSWPEMVDSLFESII